MKKDTEYRIMSGIECKILRFKRKTLAIHISEGEVFIKAPLRMPVNVINSFVEQKRNWIIEKIDAYFKKYHRFKSVLMYQTLLLHGEVSPYFFADIKKIVLKDGHLLVPEKFDKDAVYLKTQIKKFYYQFAKQYLSERLQYMAQILGFEYAGFSLSNAKTKWGSCDTKKHIRLNWRLVLLPKILQDYVIIHELCHTYFMNHSQSYWDLVSQHTPNYKALRKNLKEYSTLMQL